MRQAFGGIRGWQVLGVGEVQVAVEEDETEEDEEEEEEEEFFNYCKGEGVGGGLRFWVSGLGFRV